MRIRNNDEWLSDLAVEGPEQEAALADLRAIVLQGLPYALSGWLSTSDPRFEPLAEEVAQETLVRVLERMDSFEGRSQFTTWVHTIAVRIALTELRRLKWREVSLDELVEPEREQVPRLQVADPAVGPEAAVEKADLMLRIERVILEELTDKQRQAMLAGMRGMPMEEVARRMGTNRNALYKLLHDGRLRLKQHLMREGLTVQDILAVFEQG